MRLEPLPGGKADYNNVFCKYGKFWFWPWLWPNLGLWRWTSFVWLPNRQGILRSAYQPDREPSAILFAGIVMLLIGIVPFSAWMIAHGIHRLRRYKAHSPAPHPRYVQTWAGFRQHGNYLRRHTWRKKRKDWAKSFFWWKLTTQEIGDNLWDVDGSARERSEYHRQLGPLGWLSTWARSYPVRPLRPTKSACSNDLAERGQSSSVLQTTEQAGDVFQSTVRRRWITRAQESEMSAYLQQITSAAFQRFMAERAELDELAQGDDSWRAASGAAAGPCVDMEAAISTPLHRLRRASSLPTNFFSTPPPRNRFITQLSNASNAVAGARGDINDARPNTPRVTFPEPAPFPVTNGQVLDAAEAAMQDATYPALTPDGSAEAKSEGDLKDRTQSLAGVYKFSARLRSRSNPKRPIPNHSSACQTHHIPEKDGHDNNQKHGPAPAIVQSMDDDPNRAFSWDLSRRSTLDVPHRIREMNRVESRTLQDYEAESSIDDATALLDGSQTTASIYCGVDNDHRGISQSVDQPKLDISKRALTMLKLDIHNWRIAPAMSKSYPHHASSVLEGDEEGIDDPYLRFPRRRIWRRHSVSTLRRDQLPIELDGDSPFPQSVVMENAQCSDMGISGPQRISPVPTSIPSNDGAYERLEIPRKRAASPKKAFSNGGEPSKSEEKYTLDSLPSSTEHGRRRSPFSNPFGPNKSPVPEQDDSIPIQYEASKAVSLGRRCTSIALPTPAEILRPFSPDIALQKRSSSVPPISLSPSSSCSGVTEWQLHRRHQSIAREFSGSASAERARRRLRRVGRVDVGVIQKERTEDVMDQAGNKRQQRGWKDDVPISRSECDRKDGKSA